MSDFLDANREVILNGIHLKVPGLVSDANLSTMSGKVVTGDYTKDSHPVLSSWVFSDASGGLGIDQMNEPVHQNRYKLGTLYPRSPSQISKAHKVTDFKTSLVVSDANWRFLGNVVDNATGDWDLVFTGSPGTLVWSQINGLMGTLLDAEPVNSSVVFKGTALNTRIVIPLGDSTASGYALYSSAGGVDNVPADATHPALQSVVVWDNKLVGMDVDGQLWWTLDPGSTDTWQSYEETAKLPVPVTTRNLVTYFDRQGLPAIFVVTDTDVWQFDPNGPEMFSVDVNFPPHPHHGLAACRWAGDLYFSVGLGVHRYTGGSLSAVGLDRDHGLPIEYAGYIVGGGLVPGYNSLFAFVTAPDLSGYTFADSTPSAYSGVYEFSGTGWHLIWESATEHIVPHSMGISRRDGSGDGFVLYWGTGDTTNTTSYLHEMDLPVSFFNPLQKARVSNVFATDGWLETGTFDASMKGYNKLASAYDVSLVELADDATLTVKYKVNSADDWTTLGTVTTTGTTTLPFGTLTDGIYPGVVFEHIQFRFDLDDDSDDGFIMESAVLSYITIKPSSYSFTFGVDLSTSSQGLTPEELRDELDAILEAGQMVPFVLRGETFRVFLAQIQGSLATGLDQSATRTLTLLQVPLSLGAG